MTAPLAFPPFADYLRDGDGAELCRRVCSRVRCKPENWGRSVDGVALCRRFCRGFAAGLPMIVVRRPRAARGMN